MFNEDMSFLLRSLAETVINAAYLQVANSSEVTCFVNFDPIAGFTAIKDFEAVSGSQFAIPTELRDRIEKRQSMPL